jgi:phage terminase small subunit
VDAATNRPEKSSRRQRLTARQQAFVAYKLAHATATDSEAARAAGYSVETDRSIASRVANHPSVVAALESRVALVAAQASLSRESHLNQLERLRELAVSQGQLSAAITAEHHRGKVGGYYEDKLRLVTDRINNLTAAELDSVAEALGIE